MSNRKINRLLKSAIRSWLPINISSRLCNTNIILPSSITIDITDKCNLRCKTCDKWMSKVAPGELNTDEWKAAILKLRKWLGTFQIWFSGGEPFLRKDIFELISFANNENIDVCVVSNGSMINEEFAQRIIHSGVHAISISLNGISSKSHDYTRGVDGSYKSVKDAITWLSKNSKKINVSVGTILMGYNQDEIVDLVKWVNADRGISIYFQPIDSNSSYHSYGTASNSETRSDWYNNNELWPKNTNSMIKVIDDLIKLKRSGYAIGNSLPHLRWMKTYFQDPKKVLGLRCKVGISNFSIDPYGNIRLCFNMKPIGNIMSSDPKAIWSSSQAQQQRDDIIDCQQTCRLLNCNF